MISEEISNIIKDFNYNIEIVNDLAYLQLDSSNIHKILLLLKNNSFEVLIDYFAMPEVDNNTYKIFYHLINYNNNESICIYTSIMQNNNSQCNMNNTNITYIPESIDVYTNRNDLKNNTKINNNAENIEANNILSDNNTMNTYSIQSIIDIFHNANWFEREIYEMYNINFIGHNNLQKLFT